MTTDNQSRPPLPEPVMVALFEGNAMQGAEIRLLSSSYEPGCAQYTYDQMLKYGDARAAHARKVAIHETVCKAVGIIQENAEGCSRITESILLSQADAIKELLND